MAYGYRDDAYFFLKLRAAFPGIPWRTQIWHQRVFRPPWPPPGPRLSPREAAEYSFVYRAVRLDVRFEISVTW